ncbi:hypothetical protein CWI81_02205 [Idiomarina seosinensis]|uniref:Uncharacterized protein n=1 Tax=Idiomarina seosinensis TaxID=281739 RepID=A0A432ZH78_9GAMM|nr:hypothetical protein CWI81_02205 [Idiomarina seosinensis]
MSSFKQSFLLLFAIVCSILFVAAIVNIVFYWPSKGFDWMFLGRNVLYALATGYWVWKLLIMPQRRKVES